MASASELEQLFVAKVPEEYTSYFLENGTELRRQLYTHVKSRKDYIKCDLCSSLLLKGRSAGHFTAHRNNQTCRSRMQSNARQEEEKRETEEAELMLKKLKESVNKTYTSSDVPPPSIWPDPNPSASRSVVATPFHSLTPRASMFDLRRNSPDAPFITPVVQNQLTPKPSIFNLHERHRAEKIKQDDDDEDRMPTLYDAFYRSASMAEFYDIEDGDFDALSILDDDVLEDESNFYHPPVPRTDKSAGIPCPGQRIEWTHGSIWDTFAYQLHAPNANLKRDSTDSDTNEDSTVPWDLLSVSDGAIFLRARKLCTGYLESLHDIEAQVCSYCSDLRSLPALHSFLHRARTVPKPNTPWIYLNYRQLKDLLISQRKRIYARDKKIKRLQMRIGRLEVKINDFQRMVMMLGQGRIAGVARILATSFRNRDSPHAICDRLQMAIETLPNTALEPANEKTTWSSYELDISFLIKAMGGPRLLYVLQKAERYPSSSTVRRHKPIPEIIIPNGEPTAAHFSESLANIMGPNGRPPPKNLSIGWQVMADSASIEEILRLDLKRNAVVGLCREHSSNIKTTIDTYDDILNIAGALEKKECHRGKDGTVLAIAPISDNEDYRPSPLLLSPTCKTETGDDAAVWMQRFLDTYHNDPNGEKRHGPIYILGTDGESAFRRLRFNLGLSERLDATTAMGKLLYTLPGLNLWTGKRGLITTSDPKHIIKRFATLIRSPNGIQVGDTTITTHHCYQALTYMGAKSPKQASDLLDPADKQNVPKAVNLVETLHEVAHAYVHQKDTGDPTISHRIQRIAFFSTVLTYFLHPFIKVEMSLSDQIRGLSAYAHLITAMFHRHRNGFVTSALLADSQSVVKSIIFTVARLQALDPDLPYYLILEGTDRLEGTFSHSRTQDHARNFDSLQFSHKLAIGTEVNAIFLRHPSLDRGHTRRNLTNVQGVDHVNPRSWKGDVRVGNVDLHKEYFAGRELANDLLMEHFGYKVDFDDLFKADNVDHLRPCGKYVGHGASRAPKTSDTASASNSSAAAPVMISTSPAAQNPDDDGDNDYDDDDEILEGGVSSCTAAAGADELVSDEDMRDTTEPCDDYDNNPLDDETDPAAPQSDGLNPSPLEPTDSHYLTVEGVRKHKVVLISSILNSPEVSERKVALRPQRAAGVTEESVLRNKSRLLNYANDMIPDNQKLKANDLGATLVRIGPKVCLAVCEILSFKKKSNSKHILQSIKLDELRGSGEKSMIVTVQMLFMRPAHSHHAAEKTWIWQNSYIEVESAAARKKDDHTLTGMTNQKNYLIQVDGRAFNPLSPVIVENNSGIPVWSVTHSQLQDALEQAWDVLEPEKDDILVNIESLPNIKTEGLPYVDLDLQEQFSFPDPTLPPPLPPPSSGVAHPSDSELETRLSTSTIECQLCGKRQQLRSMRNHVGQHLLRAQYKAFEQLLDGGSIMHNPCGWCGREGEGCRTHLIRGKGSKITISSNCPYQFKGMQYAYAVKVSKTSPCTNVPLHCTICASGSTGQPVTFWKYNFLYHMAENHVNDQGDLPPLTYELLKSVHITMAEGEALGIAPEELTKHREEYGLPDSDDLRPPAAHWETREIGPGRKRGVSDLSNTERDPSPTKMARR